MKLSIFPLSGTLAGLSCALLLFCLFSETMAERKILYKCTGRDNYIISFKSADDSNIFCTALDGPTRPAEPFRDMYPIHGRLNWYRCGENGIQFSPITQDAKTACYALKKQLIKLT
ncbi:MAG: hypothetical protein DHS80DRAFT_24546 [Piptocephalis tieghemiana]|nr:MAG: hypothetical protein DHS80DRAFT_24546 [Piptocephalis tieghemiana]